MYDSPLVIHLVMWQKDGLACADVNCSHGCSLGEITAIMIRYADEEVFLLKSSRENDSTAVVLLLLKSRTMEVMKKHY